MSKEKKTWAIIGGGIMGMTLALRLTEAGQSVTLFEAANRPGGLTGSVDMNGVHWDRFYHVILLSDTYTRKIIKEIGLEEDLRWVETKTGFYSGGKLYSMSNLIDFMRFPPINLIDKLRLGITILAASLIRNWRRMEGITVEKWLRRWSGKNLFEKLWLPLLKAKLGEHYRETSALFIWTTIQRMYSARRTGLKKEMFGYVKGGYEVINMAFGDLITGKGVDIRLNSSVKRISYEKNRAFTVDTDDSSSFQFDRVISTLPSDISVRIIEGLNSDEVARHKAIKYLGVVCPSILLKNPISDYYVTNITDDWTPFTGIIEMTALVDPGELGGNRLVYLPKYLDTENEFFNLPQQELKEHFLDALFKMYPELGRNDLLHWTYSAARRVFALPTLNYSENLPSVITSIKGYYIINSAQIINGTLNVNETVSVAEKSLTEILKNDGIFKSDVKGLK